jgi:hypothetical protein
LVGQVLLGGKEWLEKWRRQIRGCQREQPQLKSIGARPTWELVAAVEELRGLAWKQMRGKRGDWGRDLVWYVGRKLGGMSLKTLGEQAGGSDYATVSAAIKRMERRLQKDSALSDSVRGLRNRLKFETRPLSTTLTTSTPPFLHLMGLNHEKLTYRYAGRDFRLTDVYGNVGRKSSHNAGKSQT